MAVQIQPNPWIYGGWIGSDTRPSSIQIQHITAERVFSDVRRSISWDRARLGSSITELLELISSWIKNGLIGKLQLL
jgi:hypothetical protein